MMEAIVSRCAGLDVHKMVIVATILLEQADGQVLQETRSFSSFRRSCCARRQQPPLAPLYPERT